MALAYSWSVDFEDKRGKGFDLNLTYKIKTINFNDINVIKKYSGSWTGGKLYESLSKNGVEFYIKKLAEICERELKKFFKDKVGRWQLLTSEAEKKATGRIGKTGDLKKPFLVMEAMVKKKVDTIIKNVKDKLLKSLPLDGSIHLKTVVDGTKDVVLGSAGMTAAGAAAAGDGGMGSLPALAAASLKTLGGMKKIYGARVKNGKVARKKLHAANDALNAAADAFGALEISSKRITSTIETASDAVKRIEAGIETSGQFPSKEKLKTTIESSKIQLEKSALKGAKDGSEEYKRLMKKLDDVKVAMASIARDVEKLEQTNTKLASDTLTNVATMQKAIAAVS